MKILVTGDWHIGVTSFGVLDENGRNSRLTDIAETIDKIVEFAHEQRVDLFVLCGDIFHTNRPTPEEQLVFLKFLTDIERYAIRTRIIIGNHDYNSQLGKGHALKLFMELGFTWTQIFDETTWEVLNNDHLFCWYPFAGKQPDMLEISKYDVKRTILACHSHLEGAVVGAEPFEIKSDKATKFKELPVDAVFAGHFHSPQLLGDNPLAFYPGSIQAVDFNERNDTKGVVLVDTSDMSFKPVGFKTRRLVQHDITTDGVVPNNGWAGVEDAIVKVNVERTEADAHTFDEIMIRDGLISSGAHSIASINLTVKREEVKRDPGIKIDSDIRSNFTRYLEQRDYGDLSDDIKQTGFEIIEKCSSK